MRQLVRALLSSISSAALLMPSCATGLIPLLAEPARASTLKGQVSEASKQGYCRYATIHGDTIIFCSEDDLWTVSADGGTARRLTAGKGVSSLPRISPDGRLVAYVCSEEGNPEIYIMPTDGGTARRVTHLGGGGLTLCGWSADGSRIFFSSNVKAPFGKAAELFSVPISGGTAKPLNLGDAVTISTSQSGAVAIGRNNLDPARWKRYHGGTAGELWVGPSLAGDFKPLISLKGNLVWPQWIGDRVYFLSDHQGVGNIYSCKTDGTDLKRHTNEIEYFVRFPSTDGKRIAYTAGARIYLFDPASNTTKLVNIESPSNLTQAKRKFVEARDYLQEYAPHPKGHSVALIVRGQPYTMPLFEGAVVDHGTGSSVRYEQFNWLPEGKRFAVVTDSPGYQQIEIHQSDETSPPVTVTSGDIGRIITMAVAPAKNRLAFSNQRHELYVLDYESKKLQKLDTSPADRISNIAWSADGRWIAYDYAETASAAIIKIADAETGTTHDATSVVRIDSAPCFDPSGKYLYFLSRRDYQPMRDDVQFDWSFPLATRPFLLTLRKDVTSPLVPKVRPFIKGKDGDEDEATGEDKEKSKDSDKDAQDEGSKKDSPSGKDKGKKDKKKIVDVKIDFDGINNRIVALPVEQGHYRQIAALDKDKVVYTRMAVKPVSPHQDWLEDDGAQGVLASYNFEEQKESVLENGVSDFALAADNQTLVYRSKNALRVIDAGKKGGEDKKEDSSRKPGRESGWLDLGRIKPMVEPLVEWQQMYREAWRLQRDNFWAPDMSKVDWDLVRKRYEALLPLVRSRGELSDLIWEMQGELGTSHAYEFLGDYEPSKSYKRGFLGADLSWDAKKNGYRIDKILRGDSWEASSDSPLAEAGLNVSEGDVITAVGGHQVSEDLSVDELLLDQAGQRVQLSIVGKDSESGSGKDAGTSKDSGKNAGKDTGKTAPPTKPRQVVVKTLRSEGVLRYRSWVEANRKLVHEASHGQLGYLHIPDMGVFGFSEFHRGYLAEDRYPGLIVDLRYNGGGNVSPLLIEKLLRKRIGYCVSRWDLPEPYPHESIGGPIVAVTNQFAGSDGDIFSHAFKQYKIGPLIGKRTWGGVVGISASRTLVDGTLTTQPEFAFWFSDVGWDVENYGVDPDEVVENTPQDYRAGKDAQLKRAIDLGLSHLKDKPFVLPNFETRPAKQLPKVLSD